MLIQTSVWTCAYTYTAFNISAGRKLLKNEDFLRGAACEAAFYLIANCTPDKAVEVKTSLEQSFEDFKGESRNEWPAVGACEDVSIHVSIHVSMRMSIHVSIHVSMRMSIHVSLHMPMHMHIHTCLCTCLCICLYTCLYAVYTRMSAHVSIHMHTSMSMSR